MDALFTEATTTTGDKEPTTWADFAPEKDIAPEAEVEAAEEEALEEDDADEEEASEAAEGEDDADAEQPEEEAPVAEKPKAKEPPRPLIVLPEKAPERPQWTVEQYHQGMVTRNLVDALKANGYQVADDGSNLQEVADTVPRLHWDQAKDWAQRQAATQTRAYHAKVVVPHETYESQRAAVDVAARMSKALPDFDSYADDMRALVPKLQALDPDMLWDAKSALGWLYAMAKSQRAEAAIKQSKQDKPKRVAVESGGARTVKTAGRKEVDPVEFLLNSNRGDRLSAALGGL